MSILFCTFAIEKRTITKPYGNTDKPHKMKTNTTKTTKEETRAAWRELGDAWLEAYEELHGE